ncbi:T-cell surface antigen CD2 [Labeo rohita]|uniref:T-cell surface antigen CD2 n=1 Tax=Labeo rohita TaxID=84645 RepID=A0ABQ8LAK6_LABRO|nr:T-cell surface antigen CD2 [Labeo rohita]
MEGDSVTLKTDVTEICEGDDIRWKYGAKKSLIATMKKSKQIDCNYNDTDGRFRYRLKLDNQTGSLTITNIKTQHAGYYQLEISGENLTLKTFNVSVYGK